MSDFAALYSALGYPFRLEAYLRVVFGLPATSTDPLPDFRKLEWIGDKKLDSVLTDLLVAHFPNATMEELHESREPLKQNKGDLAKIGRGLFIYRWLPNVSDSAGLSNHRCADIMEAILGAVWFDVYSIEKAGGKADAEVRKVIIKLWQPFLRRISRPQQFNAVVNDTSFELFAAEQLRVIQPEYILGTFPIDTERALLMNISSGQVEAVRATVQQHPILVNCYGRKSRYSALMVALQNGFIEIANFLYDHGADITHQAKDGRTAYSLAMQHQSRVPAELIRKLRSTPPEKKTEGDKVVFGIEPT